MKKIDCTHSNWIKNFLYSFFCCRIWDSRNLCLAFQFPKKSHMLTHCDFLPDGNYCVTSSNGFNSDGCEITVNLLHNYLIFSYHLITKNENYMKINAIV